MTDELDKPLKQIFGDLGLKAIKEVFEKREAGKTEDYKSLVLAVEELLASMDTIATEIPVEKRLEAARQEVYKNLNNIRDKYLGWE